MKERCDRQIMSQGEFHIHQCTRRAKIERDGKSYCGLHDPVVVAAKDKARKAKRHAEWKQKQERWDRQKREKEAGEMAIELAKFIDENGVSSAWAETNVLSKSKAILDKLEGK